MADKTVRINFEMTDGTTQSVEFTVPQGDTGPQGPKGDPYTLTEADKAEISAMVIESLGGNPVFGYVDENNNIVVQGNLADGTYSVKYEMEDGSTVDIGNLVLDSNVYYTVTNNLTNCTNSNTAAEAIGGEPYSAVISANSGYELSSVVVTMGGNPVSVSGGNISIAEVTGDIVITAVATEKVVTPSYTNLADSTSADWVSNARLNGTCTVTPVADLGADISNYIPLTLGSTVRVKGMDIKSKLPNGSVNRSAVYNSSKTYITPLETSTTVTSYITVDDNGVYSVTIDNAIIRTMTGNANANYTSLAYIRLCGTLTGTKEDVIITVNEPIV